MIIKGEKKKEKKKMQLKKIKMRLLYCQNAFE
jgi:hypothetical protein